MLYSNKLKQAMMNQKGEMKEVFNFMRQSCPSYQITVISCLQIGQTLCLSSQSLRQSRWWKCWHWIKGTSSPCCNSSKQIQHLNNPNITFPLYSADWDMVRWVCVRFQLRWVLWARCPFVPPFVAVLRSSFPLPGGRTVRWRSCSALLFGGIFLNGGCNFYLWPHLVLPSNAQFPRTVLLLMFANAFSSPLPQIALIQHLRFPKFDGGYLLQCAFLLCVLFS